MRDEKDRNRALRTTKFRNADGDGNIEINRERVCVCVCDRE